MVRDLSRSPFELPASYSEDGVFHPFGSFSRGPSLRARPGYPGQNGRVSAHLISASLHLTSRLVIMRLLPIAHMLKSNLTPAVEVSTSLLSM